MESVNGTLNLFVVDGRKKMDEFLQALTKIIEQYGDVVLTLGIVTFVITFILELLVFAIVMKSLWDEDRKWKK